VPRSPCRVDRGSRSRARGLGLWRSGGPQGAARAAAENKELLIYFTGSDWCPGSQRLDTEILNQEAFQTLAQRFFVLVKLDYPQTAEQKAEIRSILDVAKEVGLKAVI